ncbi:stalk domain-containing protein [Neobacillus sp. PS3-34]|uniref:stalk domain-containing protein n=1 Tax=Neobacillus sp. PS3-34 TaxID=3070678 RepID=UPI0027E018B2|nr:stalk domain-containing protein [Neobacillus sp. PS3-34]WML47120.1 stalk domain-containing protein [Neobacillus sp. PS3-34]
MKKTVSSLIIAGLIVNAVPTILPINTASAAKITTAAKIKTTANAKIVAGQKNINLNGVNGKLSSIVYKGKTLYSVKEIAAAFKVKYFYDKKSTSYKLSGNGKTISFKQNDSFMLNGNKKVSLYAPVTSYKNQMYIHLDPVVLGLDGDYIYNASSQSWYISTNKLVKGSASDAKWIDGSRVMFMNEVGEDGSTYLMDVQKKSFKQFNTTEMSVSPDGKQAVYTDENDMLMLADLVNGTTRQLNSDNDAYKANFIWSADGSKVFFLQGDTSAIISSVSIIDGTITKILDDKKDYKSDLRVSQDGKKLVYTLGNTAVTKYTDDAKTDVSDIDTTNTDPQLFLADLTASTLAPVAITASTENKNFASILADGSVIYLGDNTEDENKLPVLYKISSDGKTASTLVDDKEINSVQVSAQGNIFILVEEQDGSSGIYQLNGTSLVKKATFKDTISTFSVSPDETKFALTVSNDNGDHIEIFKNGNSDRLTKN